MKKIIVLLLVLLTMTVVAGVTLAATCCIKVYVDGSQVVFPDQQPFVNADSRTLVPVRFV